MSEKRTVTVSITINLGNYENLRLEVSDIAETKEEADELRRFLSDVLDGYANNNATAKETIDKYKDRILADAAAEEEPEASFGFFSADEPLPFAPLPAEECEPEAVEPLPFSMPEPEVEEREAGDEIVSAPQAASPETAEFTCSKCGAPVTKLQRDVSMLFNHKILCKDCMK